MKKRTVGILLAAHLAVTWLAVPLRIDEFPLTWAPMYSVQTKNQADVWSVVLKDRERLESDGWRALRADGGEERVRRADLNVPTRSMWRLYFERTWKKAPPRHKHKNAGGATLDRWLLGLAPGAPIHSADWERRLLMSVNHTLGRAPGEPGFIVRLSAERVRLHFAADSMQKVGETRDRAAATWRPAWDAEFE